MEFRQLQTFVEVVHTGSFTDAAANLFLSQPTVSQHIRQIESELGTRLVIRTTRRIEITSEGRTLCAYAEDLLSLRDRMITNCSKKKQHILSIGASTIPSAYILPKVLPSFGKEHPEIYFSIRQSDSAGVENGILEGIYDLGLTGREPEHDQLEATPFCKDHMVLITPVNDFFLEKKRQGASVRELLDEPIILREEGSGSLKAADRYLASEDIREEDLNVVARANDQEAIKNMVAVGMGISFISERAAEGIVEEKRVLSFELPGDAAERRFYAVTRKDEIPSSSRSEFIRFLKNACR